MGKSFENCNKTAKMSDSEKMKFIRTQNSDVQFKLGRVVNGFYIKNSTKKSNHTESKETQTNQIGTVEMQTQTDSISEIESPKILLVQNSIIQYKFGRVENSIYIRHASLRIYY